MEGAHLVRKETAELQHAQREGAAEHERRDDAGGRDADGAPPVPRDEIHAELEADAEHVKHESDLTEDEQRVLGIGGEQPRLQVRRDPSEERRS